MPFLCKPSSHCKIRIEGRNQRENSAHPPCSLTMSEEAVSAEDQDRINTFNKANIHNNELLAKIEAKKKSLQDLEDASEEAMITMEADALMLRVGECFIRLPEDAISEHIECEKGRLSAELEHLRAESDRLREQMDQLKATLYARFGQQINLEP
ncbi:unnamed protein product [Vitrella brassicaformis CCMP3155]|uniref:Prefoldin subunit 4 n=1 Tax=Vitrella brassicaformis (strain CCMP3155) TaxID=1169540 RepID=A0A0G4FGZ3_VITBC|nr:unnamed protein product [Vitrella brassicaformis CCMP3155]|eukprot:CEM12125.1 unnamed protein product [Vitrella brassicaformis CCMP3155]